METIVIAINRGLQRFAANREPEDLSAAVNVALDQYQDILAKSLPDLFPEEWMLIFDALKTHKWLEPLDVQLLWLSVAGSVPRGRTRRKVGRRRRTTNSATGSDDLS